MLWMKSINRSVIQTEKVMAVAGGGYCEKLKIAGDDSKTTGKYHKSLRIVG